MLFRCVALIVCAFAVGCAAFGQTSYVYKTDYSTDGGHIYALEGNALTHVVELSNEVPLFGDIAVAPDSSLYGLSQGGEIHRIDLETGTTTVEGAYAAFSAHTAFVIDQNWKAYTLDFFFDLICYDLQSGTETLLGNLGELSPGDLAFYRGKLCFPSGTGFIKSIDPETLAMTNIYCLPPDIIELQSVFGMTNLFDSCGVEHLVLCNTANRIFDVDVEAGTYVDLMVTCDIAATGAMWGMAGMGDVRSSACDAPITETDCTESYVSPVVLRPLLIGPNPVSDVLYTYADLPLTRLELRDTRGALIRAWDWPHTRLELADLPQGIYVLEGMDTRGVRYRSKVLKD